MKCKHCGHEHPDCGEIASLLVGELQLMRLALQGMEHRVDYWLSHPGLEDAVRGGQERLLAAVHEEVAVEATGTVD